MNKLPRISINDIDIDEAYNYKALSIEQFLDHISGNREVEGHKSTISESSMMMYLENKTQYFPKYVFDDIIKEIRDYVKNFENKIKRIEESKNPLYVIEMTGWMMPELNYDKLLQFSEIAEKMYSKLGFVLKLKIVERKEYTRKPTAKRVYKTRYEYIVEFSNPNPFKIRFTQIIYDITNKLRFFVTYEGNTAISNKTLKSSISETINAVIGYTAFVEYTERENISTFDND